LAQAFLGIGKHPAMVAQHRNRAGMQIARARIIAEPGPHPQHVVLRGAAERSDIRPARQKFLEIRPDRFDAGLLQHDFGQPDPIRIGRSPAGGRHGSRRRWRSYQSSSSAGREAPSAAAGFCVTTMGACSTLGLEDGNCQAWKRVVILRHDRAHVFSKPAFRQSLFATVPGQRDGARLIGRRHSCDVSIWFPDRPLAPLKS
jgi:hypothetical protein